MIRSCLSPHSLLLHGKWQPVQFFKTVLFVHCKRKIFQTKVWIHMRIGKWWPNSFLNQSCESRFTYIHKHKHSKQACLHGKNTKCPVPLSDFECRHPWRAPGVELYSTFFHSKMKHIAHVIRWEYLSVMQFFRTSLFVSLMQHHSRLYSYLEKILDCSNRFLHKFLWYKIRSFIGKKGQFWSIIVSN